MSFKMICVATFAMSTIASGTGNAEDLIYRSPSGMLSVLEVQEADSFLGVLSRIKEEVESEDEVGSCKIGTGEYILDFMAVATPTKYAPSAPSSARVYQALTTQQQKDITYVITTLGMGSYAKIALSKSNLKQAGQRLKDVHPFQFLAWIFSNEKLKAAVHNITKKKLFVWSGFYEGVRGSLSEEAELNNLADYVEDFATNVKIDAATIQPLIANRKWKDFVNELMRIPREGDNGRYDM